MPDPFLGTWILQADQSDYQFGDPPAAGTYTIAPAADGEHDGAGYLVTMAWTDAAGQAHELSYFGIPDGQTHPFAAPDPEKSPVDATSMTRVDERTLDSASFKAGKQIAHARRHLAPDGRTMTVTQSGTTPAGKPFANVSTYRRQP